MNDLEPLTYFLELEMHALVKGLFENQLKYA